MALKTSTAYGQSCRSGTSYSHEFSDSGYSLHFTRYWFGHGDDAVEVSSQHGAGGSFPYTATPVAVGVSAADLANLVQEVNNLRETLGQTQRTNVALQDRVKTLETGQTRMEAQLTS